MITAQQQKTSEKYDVFIDKIAKQRETFLFNQLEHAGVRIEKKGSEYRYYVKLAGSAEFETKHSNTVVFDAINDMKEITKEAYNKL